jgi:hypothetical protein
MRQFATKESAQTCDAFLGTHNMLDRALHTHLISRGVGLHKSKKAMLFID